MTYRLSYHTLTNQCLNLEAVRYKQRTILDGAAACCCYIYGVFGLFDLAALLRLPHLQSFCLYFVDMCIAACVAFTSPDHTAPRSRFQNTGHHYDKNATDNYYFFVLLDTSALAVHNSKLRPNSMLCALG